MPTANSRPARTRTRPRGEDTPLARSAALAGLGWGVLGAVVVHLVLVAAAFAAWVSAPGSTFTAADSVRAGTGLSQLALGAVVQLGQPLDLEGGSTHWAVRGGPTLVVAAAGLLLAWGVRRLVRGLVVDDRVPDAVPVSAALGAAAGWCGSHLLVGLAAGLPLAPGGLGRWVLGVVLIGVAVCAAGLLTGVPHRRRDVWFSGWPGDAGEVLQDATLPALRCLGLLLVAGLVALVAVLTAGWQQVLEVHRALGVGPGSSVVLTGAQLGWLPTAVLWALAWLAGPGVALGAGALSPAGAPSVAWPAVPVLAAVPEGGNFSSGWWAVLMVPVAVGALLPGMVRRGVAEFVEQVEPVGELLRCAVAAGLIGLGAGLFGFLATVGVGPGPLAHLGPHPMTGPALAGELLVGALLRWGVELGRERLSRR